MKPKPEIDRIEHRFALVDLLRYVVAGLAGAVVMLLIQHGYVSANDCIEYVKRVQNLYGAPKGVIEDCMRTGSVQAVVTAIIASMGGGATAIAVGKAVEDMMKGYKEGEGTVTAPPKDNPFDPNDDEKRRMWEKEKVVWDPETLSWRPPKPDELPPPKNPPEELPPIVKQLAPPIVRYDENGNPVHVIETDEETLKRARAAVPPQCLDLFDEYVNVQASAMNVEEKIQELTKEMQQQKDWMLMKAGILAAQFSIDTIDMTSAASGLVKMAQPISTAIGKMGTFAETLRQAGYRAASLAKTCVELAKEVAEFGVKAKSLRSAAELAAESAKFMAKKADDLAEAAIAMDKRVAKNRNLLKAVQDIDVLKAERATVVSKLMDAEKRLAASEALWAKRRNLQTWAEGERASTTASQARLALDAEAELADLQEQLRNLNAKVAQSPEVTNSAKRYAKATTELNALQAEIREIESQIALKVKQIETVRKLNETKAVFLEAEQALDEAHQVQSAAQKKLENIRKKIEAATNPKRIAELQEEIRTLSLELTKVEALKSERAGILYKAERDVERVNAEIMDAVEARQGPPTPEENARLAAAQAHRSEAEQAYKASANEQTVLNNQLSDRNTELSNLRAKGGELGEDLGLDAQRLDAEAELNAATAKVTEKDAAYTQAAQEMQSVSHPGVDPNAGPRLEAEKAALETTLPQKKAELPAKNAEFDEAHNIDQNVRTQLEATEREALNAKLQNAQTKKERANRSWEEVAKEKDPGKFAEWEAEVKGRDPFNESTDALAPEHAEVQRLKKEEADIERQINSRRDQVPADKTPEELMSEIDRDANDLPRAQADAEAARTEADGQARKASEAEGDAQHAESQYKNKEAELQTKAAEHKQAEVDLHRAQEDPAAPPPPDFGTPDPAASGSMQWLDALTKRSHELSQQFKPDWAVGIESRVKSGAQWFGAKWERAFNGQSPAEVMEKIKEHADNVNRLNAEIQELSGNAQYDRSLATSPKRQAMEDLKARLDHCIEKNTFWQGPSNP